MKYIGLHLSGCNKDIFQNNYNHLWKEIKQDLERRKCLKLSWRGLLETIKMNILSKMNFLYQMAATPVSNKNLQHWQRRINRFTVDGVEGKTRI